MSAPKWTPGWRLEENGFGLIAVRDAANRWVTYDASGGGSTEQAEANARLIVAAQDLYAALKETIEAVTFVDVRIPKKLRREFDRALAALAKARGES